jgi:hypothetical protein
VSVFIGLSPGTAMKEDSSRKRGKCHPNSTPQGTSFGAAS